MWLINQYFVSFGDNHRVTFKNEKQGTGTADHMISLDYLFRVGQDQGLRGQDWDLQDQDWDLRGQDLGLQSWPQRTDGWMDGRTEILPCVLQDFVPFGSAALLPSV